MRKTIAMMALLALLAPACKTTEANYRAAYEKTMEARRAQDAIDSTIYGQVRRQTALSTEEVEPGVSVDVRSQLVRVTEGGGGIRENLRRYCVVAGQFKQRFNAISLRDRLAAAGYPGAFVVETAEPFYYIIAGSYSTLPEAYTALKELEAASPVAMKSPVPFILKATAR